MQKKNPWLVWFLAAAALAILPRIAFWSVYQPVETSDTNGYELAGRIIASLDLAHNPGARTPVYPLIMAANKYNNYSIWLTQIVAGFLISVLLFVFTWRMTRNAPAAFAVSVLNSLNLAQLAFEATIITETVSTLFFLITLGLAASIRVGGRRQALLSALLGLAVGILVLTRPNFIYLVPLYIVYVWWQSRGAGFLARSGIVVSHLLPSLGLILGWSAVNWRATGYFAPTTMTGYYLMNHTGNFIEYAPEKYATVRDIYLAHRGEQIAKEGSQSMTIWRSYYDLRDATGLSEANLSKVLAEMSVVLIVQHPDLYLESVAPAWTVFWKVSNFWKLDKFRYPAIGPVLDKLWTVERLAVAFANILFLLLGLWWVALWVRRRLLPDQVHLLLIWVVVLGGSVFQALLERGDNARYAVPYEPIIVYCVVVGVAALLRRVRDARKPLALPSE
jgi:4-amino-4-deoxy-L-arabinose transferase-like glycosyltransferase